MDLIENVVTQGQPTGDITSNFGANAQGNGIVPQTQNSTSQTTDQQIPNRESYFQSNFDKLASYWKNQGLEIKPDMDYENTFQNYVQAYNAVNEMRTNPEVLLQAARERYPDQFIQPDYTNQVSETLLKEFGEDFIPNAQEAMIIGTPSWKYVQRMNSINSEIVLRETQQKIMSEMQQEYEKQQKQKQFDDSILQLSTEVSLPKEQIMGYLDTLKDPNFWSLKNLVNLAQIAKGEYSLQKRDTNIQPQTTQQMQGPPPSPGNIGGGVNLGQPATFESWAGL